jgi:DNA-binding GntR family transcriptional regulator
MTCDRLRQEIIEGGFQPDERLKERNLAQQFGVSTTPIKEALQRLELEGLVRSLPLRGSCVAEDINSILAEAGIIRAALEGVAVHLATIKATEAEIIHLQGQVKVMERWTEEENVEKAIEANTKFHELIHDVSHNRHLQQMMKVVRSYDRATRLLALSDASEMRRGLADHKAILKAIVESNPELAEQKMREHVSRTSRFVQNQKSSETE